MIGSVALITSDVYGFIYGCKLVELICAGFT